MPVAITYAKYPGNRVRAASASLRLMIYLLDAEQHPGVDAEADEANYRAWNDHPELAGEDAFERRDEKPELEQQKHELEQKQRDEDGGALPVAEVADRLHASFTPLAKI